MIVVTLLVNHRFRIIEYLKQQSTGDEFDVPVFPLNLSTNQIAVVVVDEHQEGMFDESFNNFKIGPIVSYKIPNMVILLLMFMSTIIIIRDTCSEFYLFA